MPVRVTTVSIVRQEDILDMWPMVLPMVEKALVRACGDNISPGPLLSGLLSGDLTLHFIRRREDDRAVVDAVMILRIVKRDKGNALVVMLVSGEKFWDHAETVHDMLRDYARQHDVYVIEAVVRDGMSKWLPKFGWSRKAVVMKMEI